MVNQTEMDRTLYSSMWISQCKEIDTSLLDFKDVILVEKCIHQQEITDDELEQLRLLLRDYNNVNNECNISKAEDNIDNFREIITSEQQFLDLVDSQEETILEKEFTIDGKKHTVRFIVDPVLDSRTLFQLVDHAKLFDYIPEEEKKILKKAGEGKSLNDREQKMVARLNSKLESKLTTGENFEYMVTSFLARQVRLEDSTLKTFDERMDFWYKVDFGIRIDLFNTTKDMVNSGDDGLFR